MDVNSSTNAVNNPGTQSQSTQSASHVSKDYADGYSQADYYSGTPARNFPDVIGDILDPLGLFHRTFQQRYEDYRADNSASRAVEGLKRAGLNPALAGINQSIGYAPVGSGASANKNSGTGAGSLISSAAKLIMLLALLA